MLLSPPRLAGALRVSVFVLRMNARFCQRASRVREIVGEERTRPRAREGEIVERDLWSGLRSKIARFSRLSPCFLARYPVVAPLYAPANCRQKRGTTGQRGEKRSFRAYAREIDAPFSECSHGLMGAQAPSFSPPQGNASSSPLLLFLPLRRSVRALWPELHIVSFARIVRRWRRKSKARTKLMMGEGKKNQLARGGAWLRRTPARFPALFSPPVFAASFLSRPFLSLSLDTCSSSSPPPSQLFLSLSLSLFLNTQSTSP